MNEKKYISSLKNPVVRQIVQLQEKSRQRKNLGLFVLEGHRELAMAIKAKYEIQTLLYAPGIISEASILNILKESVNDPELIQVSNPVYQKIAYRDSTEGVVAIAKQKSHLLDDLHLDNDNALILVAEAPEKPGNIGALLRTADAANLDAVLIANPKGDLYNPNIIRSSIGCVFTNKIAVASTSEILKFLQDKNIAIYCAALSASEVYTRINFAKKAALVVGTESTGLTDAWLEASTKNIIIPMEGEIDSMNVSVSAAILIFEVKRQRSI
ncbi:MAG: RNA methyltransferase [Maribacter sp.]|nr:RNA methyltransferase [Maribacter sp.]